MALQRTPRPRLLKLQSGLGDGLAVQEHAGTGRSLRSLGAPLNAQPLGVPSSGQRPFSVAVTSRFAVQAGRSPLGGK
jgi:hypothetical protein